MPERKWTDRVWHEFRARHLTPLERDVLLRLAEYPGEAWPAHTTLAERARCSVRTVQRALAKGREFGLVRWFERRVRRGWRWLRTSSRYVLLLPPEPVAATTGQNARGLSNKNKSRRFEPETRAPVMDQHAARRALAKVALARLLRLSRPEW